MSINEAKKAFKQAMNFAEKNQALEKVCVYAGLYELTETISNIERELKEIKNDIQVLKCR